MLKVLGEACTTPYRLRASTIQLREFLDPQDLRWSFGTAGLASGDSKYSCPQITLFFPTGSQKSKLFARGVNENKCFMVWWWSGMGLLWPLTLLLKKQPTSSQLPWTNLHLPSAWQLKATDLLREPKSCNSRITPAPAAVEEASLYQENDSWKLAIHVLTA